jgi:NAD(P)-dependent dehydrogenase (short-subunit alcohol dehydrogenase family)
MGQLDGKVALVVGGGSRFGQAIAVALAREGATIAVGCGDEASGCAATALVAAEGGTATHVLMDPADGASVTAAFEAALAAHGRIDVVVTRVVSPPRESKPVEELTEGDWADAARHIVRAAALPLGAAIRAMTARGVGSVVVIGSTAGLPGGEGPATLVTASTALTGLTRAAAAELKAAGSAVRVNLVALGLGVNGERAAPKIVELAADGQASGQMVAVV